MTTPKSNLSLAAADLYDALTTLWTQYLDFGPGKVAAESFATFSEAHRSLASLTQSTQQPNSASSNTECALHEFLVDAQKLADMCANTPQGLCFVTGEAGLIPRRDLHEKMEAAIEFFGKLASTEN